MRVQISLLQHELEAEREEVVRLRKQLSEERSLSLRHRPPQSAWHGSWTHASPPGSVSAPPPPLASDPAKASSTTSKKWVSFFSRFNVDNMRRSSSVSYLQSAVTLLAEELLICEQVCDSTLSSAMFTGCGGFFFFLFLRCGKKCSLLMTLCADIQECVHVFVYVVVKMHVCLRLRSPDMCFHLPVGETFIVSGTVVSFYQGGESLCNEFPPALPPHGAVRNPASPELRGHRTSLEGVVGGV